MASMIDCAVCGVKLCGVAPPAIAAWIKWCAWC